MIRRNFIKKTAVAGTALSVVPAFMSSFTEIERDVTITPDEIDDILANPGIGWQTFGRAAKSDKNLPAWIPSTVCYYRWGWDKMEPAKGKIDRDFLDKYLQEVHDSGQQLAFRVMTTYPGRKIYPDWLKEAGGKIDYTEVFIDGEKHSDNPVPDFNDDIVRNAHIDFIKNLGSIYDGHPDIDHFDLGTVGWWGEWHLSGQKAVAMPSPENMKKIVDAYISSFKKTPLVIPIGSNKFKMLDYATSKGAGWRADCFGDMNWHMTKYYTQALAGDNALDAWKKGPVAWESCWEAKKWVAEGWPLRFIFNYGLVLHGSVLNNKSATLPEGEEVKAEIIRFLRRLGYRYVLKEIKLPSIAKAGSAVELNMKWQNKGSAPAYRPYRLAYRLSPVSGSGKEKKFVSQVTVNNWMPGDMKLDPKEYLKNPVDLPFGEIYQVSDKFSLPADIQPGKYLLSLAVTGEGSGSESDPAPVLQLGIKGRQNDGWYKLSEITIQK